MDLVCGAPGGSKSVVVRARLAHGYVGRRFDASGNRIAGAYRVRRSTRGAGDIIAVTQLRASVDEIGTAAWTVQSDH
jgi:hypothetical protein